jgi:hypothetical protein
MDMVPSQVIIQLIHGGGQTEEDTESDSRENRGCSPFPPSPQIIPEIHTLQKGCFLSGFSKGCTIGAIKETSFEMERAAWGNNDVVNTTPN